MKRHLFSFCAAILVALFISVHAFAQAPSISSFTPSSGPVGTLVTITGSNLGGATSVSIGGVAAIIVADTSVVSANYGDTLKAFVMPGTNSGAVSVTTGSGNTSGNNFNVVPTPWPKIQQGTKLVGTGSVAGMMGTQQGYSVAISADGNTAMTVAPQDNNNDGAVWTYTHNGSTWTQLGSKLTVGAGASISSVALSADGSIAVVGGIGMNSSAGAVWVFTRSGNTWTQQGNILDGSGSGLSYQGISVAISADGKTLVETGRGFAFVFTRSGSTWTQQGGELIGTGESTNGSANPNDYPVSISSDGNTFIIGSSSDNGSWVFTRSGGVWTQQGSELVGAGAVGNAYQGKSVALSADGNTAIIGGYADSNNMGAAWVFTRSGGLWTQQGNKLVGTGSIIGTYAVLQGYSVALSADGNTAMVGGMDDNGGVGATWVFTRSGSTWTQQGNKLLGTGTTYANEGASVALTPDAKTSIIGGDADAQDTGAVWIFVSCSNTGDTTATACDSLMWYGNYYSASGNYTKVLTNVGGCDSTVTLHLTVNHSTTGDTTATACDSLLWYGNYYAATGNYTNVLMNSTGCDSTVTLHLTVNHSTTGDTTAIACDSLMWYGNYYTATGNYTNVLMNSTGCDSTVTLHLTVNHSTTGDTTATACGSFTWYGTTYTSTGTATHVFATSTSCDSTVTLHLTIGSLTASVSQSGDSLVASPAGATYQWINCNNNNDAINGATGQSYAPTSDGSYAVVVSQGPCTDTTACHTFTGVQELSAQNSAVNIYPNPSTGSFTVTSTVEGTYYIVNELGQRVKVIALTVANNKSANVTGLSNGVYTLIGYQNNKIISKRIVVTK